MLGRTAIEPRARGGLDWARDRLALTKENEMIKHELIDDVLEIQISRPEKRNALTHEMYDEMRELLLKYGRGESARAILFYGSEGIFSAGADLEDFKKPRKPGESHGIQFIRALASCEVPIIAAVEGFAVGIGATMLLHCDFVYTTEECKFRFPFVALGLCPEAGSTYLLEKLVGPRRAVDWLMSCRYIYGDEAYESGFVTALTEAGATLEKARQRAIELIKFPSSSVNATKRLMKGHYKDKLTHVIDREVEEFNSKLETGETQSLVSKGTN